MDIKYFVIKNTGEHSAQITDVDMNDIWSNENPNGWTYQDLQGAHGYADGPYDTEAEARAEMDEWLKCDSVAKGRYCYTHNRI